MTLHELYELSIELGIAMDVRGAEGIRRVLEARRQEYEALPAWEQAFYDLERLRNPFGDVRIARGPDDVELRTVLLGIDIDAADIQLADALAGHGRPIDAVIAHHTPNTGVAPNLANDIMDVNVDMLVAQGVPREDAVGVIKPYVDERWRNNEDMHRLGPTTAALLDLPLACIHTPADYAFEVGIGAAVERDRPATTGAVLESLMTFPEVQSAARFGALPRIMSGAPDWPTGRFIVKGGGGKIYPPGAYPLLGAAGVNTVIQIGCGPEHTRAAQAAGVCIIRVPHAACDNIGINLLFDDVERTLGRLEVVGCRGFERISRLGGSRLGGSRLGAPAWGAPRE